MIIEKVVQLELEAVEIRENPMNQKGKFVCYQFRMSYPSSYHFFKQSKTFDSKHFSIIWGTSPTIEFLDKGHKEFSAMILPKIIADLPPSFTKEHIGNWRLAIGDYTSPVGDRKWVISYSAATYNDKDRVRRLCERSIPIDANFMSRIVAALPVEITGLKVIRK